MTENVTTSASEGTLAQARSRPSVRTLRELNNNANTHREVPLGLALVKYRRQRAQMSDGDSSNVFHHTRSAFAKANVENHHHIGTNLDEKARTFKHLDKNVQKSMAVKRREEAAAWKSKHVYRTAGPVYTTEDDPVPRDPRATTINAWVDEQQSYMIPPKSLRSKPPPFKAVAIDKTTWYRPAKLREQLPVTERLYQVQTCSSLERMRELQAKTKIRSMQPGTLIFGIMSGT